MPRKIRVLKSGNCEITQGYSSSHSANDIVGADYTLDYIVAHTDGVINFFQDGYDNAKGSTGNASYGNCVKIKHKNGFETLYAHMQKGLSVKNGQSVKKGQILGYMGNTGNSYGGHLHFEVRKNGSRIDPTPYLNTNLYNEVELPNPVSRNEEMLQIEVVENQLRCRTGHSTNDEIIGFIPVGIYNIVSNYQDEIYTWYEVEKGKWIANNGTWVKILDIKKEEPVEEPKNEPVEEPKQEENTNTLPSNETSKEEQKNEASNKDFINMIINYILKLIKGLFK